MQLYELMENFRNTVYFKHELSLAFLWFKQLASISQSLGN